MSVRRQRRRARKRVGRVSVYHHHGTWWIYYRLNGTPVRRKVAVGQAEAEQIAAQLNAQLTTGAPTAFSFTPIAVSELRQQFLDHHEHVVRSSLATISRYRAATKHLENFVREMRTSPSAHEIDAGSFTAYLRHLLVAPNGHPNTKPRRLRDKGIRYILECCRSMYNFAHRCRHLPPYAGNPFAVIPIEKLRVEDAKPIFVFDASTELQFFRVADRWSLAIHAVLAKTGLRVGELVHLLIEDVDLRNGWLQVRGKPELGWRTKTGNERAVPLVQEIVNLLERVIGSRAAGPVFLRQSIGRSTSLPLIATRAELAVICRQRQLQIPTPLARSACMRIARSVWRDAGAIKADAVRSSFMRISKNIGRPEATCPKSWRHTFATLLQDANVDPLIRQITLGHSPASRGGLGMTAHYTHTRPDTQRRQIEEALRSWPKSLELISSIAQGGVE